MEYILRAVHDVKVIVIAENIFVIYDSIDRKWYIKMGKAVQLTTEFFYNSVYSQNAYPVEERMCYLIDTSDGDTEVVLEKTAL